MPHPQITGNAGAQAMLKHRFIGYRWRTPFVTDVRMSKAEAHARAWQEMMAAKRAAEIQARMRR